MESFMSNDDARKNAEGVLSYVKAFGESLEKYIDSLSAIPDRAEIAKVMSRWFRARSEYLTDLINDSELSAAESLSHIVAASVEIDVLFVKVVAGVADFSLESVLAVARASEEAHKNWLQGYLSLLFAKQLKEANYEIDRDLQLRTAKTEEEMLSVSYQMMLIEIGANSDSVVKNCLLKEYLIVIQELWSLESSNLWEPVFTLDRCLRAADAMNLVKVQRDQLLKILSRAFDRKLEAVDDRT